MTLKICNYLFSLDLFVTHFFIEKITDEVDEDDDEDEDPDGLDHLYLHTLLFLLLLPRSDIQNSLAICNHVQPIVTNSFAICSFSLVIRHMLACLLQLFRTSASKMRCATSRSRLGWNVRRRTSKM